MRRFDKPFQGMDVLLCGDLCQLPRVGATEIYKSGKKQVCMQTDMLWQHFRLPSTCAEVMRQKEVFFSTLLTKNGNGDSQDEEDVRMLQSRFVTTAVAKYLCPGGVRFFYSNNDADAHNSSLVTGDSSMVVSNADEIIISHKSQNQYDNAKVNLATMKLRHGWCSRTHLYLRR